VTLLVNVDIIPVLNDDVRQKTEQPHFSATV